MNKLKLAKKFLLGTATVSMLAVAILAGLFTQSVVLAQQDEPLLQIVKVAPVYPQRAAQSGIEGYVVVEYTVTEQGTVEDVSVVESSSSLFDNAAVESVRKYKYRPRVQNGQAVAVPGVRSRILFPPLVPQH